MATFIMTGRYSVEAMKQISAERTVKAKQIVRECGGSIVGVYATMGNTDILAIVEFPGVGEAIKAAVGLSAAMGISFSTVPAMALDEFDKLIGGRS